MTSRPYVETLVFVGGISADVRAWVATHPEGDAPVAWATEGRLAPGGRAAMAATGAVRLGRRFVDLVGAVGDDLLGESIVDSLKAEGVSVRLVDRIEGVATAMNQVVVDRRGVRLTVGVANANWHVGEVQLRKADSTIFGADLLFATLEVPMDTVQRVITTASNRKVPVMLDATPVPTAAAIDVLNNSLLSKVDVLLVNWPSALRLAGLSDVAGPVGVELAQKLLGQGAKALVITMGEHGSLVAVPGRHALIEPYTVRAIDTTSAGDAFAAALAVGLTAQSRGNYRWEHLLQAVRFASGAAAAAVTRIGGPEALPTREEVERLMTSQPQSGRPSTNIAAV